MLKDAPNPGGYYLAFYGCSFTYGVALMKDDHLLWETPQDLSFGQSQPLIAWIECALQAGKISAQDLQGIVTTRGPGSFTGVRAGLAIASAFDLVLGCPIIALDSFTWIYHGHSLKGPKVLVLESRREELFCVLYDPKSLELAPTFLKEQDIESHFKGFEVYDNRKNPLLLPCSLISVAKNLGAFKAPHVHPLAPLYVRTADVSQPKIS
jgi:tRNA threonylcarbamoyl adenosine modification protein YeaZ